jgi:hypothetical protein
VQTENAISEVQGSVGAGLKLTGLLGNIPSAYSGERKRKRTKQRERQIKCGI